MKTTEVEVRSASNLMFEVLDDSFALVVMAAAGGDRVANHQMRDRADKELSRVR